MTALLLGILVGLVLGLTGAGGSIFAVPLLVIGLELDLTEATPVALLAVFGATAFGALMALRAGHVCHRAALMIGVAGSVATPAGVYLASRASQHVVYLAFAAVMLIVAARMFLQARTRSGPTAAAPPPDHEPIAAVCSRDPQSQRLGWTSRCALMLGLSGVGTGILSGALGIGAGFVIVPSLRAATSLSMTSVVATSLLAIAIISGSAVGSHLLHGNRIPWLVATPFLIGALLGMWAGRILIARISGARLQQSFAALMAAAALVMAYRGI
jgi:uncharacterized membrane protein YfcA